MPTLLIVDDDPFVLQSLAAALSGDGVEVQTAPSAIEGLERFVRSRPNVVLSDIRLPDLTGLELLDRFRDIDATVPIILMTGRGTAETAIEAMRRGAFDYVLKPPELDELEELVRKAFEVGRLMRAPALVSDDDDAEVGDTFIGKSKAMQDVFKAVGRVAATDATVLILGESGTGKELVARSVYHYSPRAGKPFHALNCAAVPDALLESELFGHEKGSFTGADRKRLGRFEQCNGGTIFLDEIGDMTLLTQAKVLRLIQEQRFERVGGNTPIQTDVRLIAATHRDLEAMIADGTFREDLYYRLNVCPIHLPPLRERRDDVPLLVRHFLRSLGGPNATKWTVAADVLDALAAHPWPGNVRQLQSVVRQSVLRASGGVLTADSLPATFGVEKGTETSSPSGGAVAGPVVEFIRERIGSGSNEVYPEVVSWVERSILTEVLRYTNGNLSQASLILGITRPTIRVKMKALGIAVENEAHIG